MHPLQGNADDGIARLRGAPLDRAARDRMYRYLAARGFSASDIRAALHRYASDSEFEPGC